MLRQLCLLAVVAAAAVSGPVPQRQPLAAVPAVHPVGVKVVSKGALPSAIRPSSILKKNQVSQYVKEIGNANQYIDMVLANLNPLLPARVDLPDIGGMFNIHNCYIHGLDNGIVRTGDATSATVGQTVKFTSELGASNVGVTCRWKYLLLFGDATGVVETISIATGMSLELSSGSSPQCTEFRVLEMSPIVMDITGLTFLFNWLAEDIANFVIQDYMDMIINVFETVVRVILDEVLTTIVLP